MRCNGRRVAVALGALALVGCGGDDEGLARPNAVCLGDDGRAWVSDFHHQRIVGYDRDGRRFASFGGQGLGEGALWQPWDVACPGGGVVVVANQRLTASDSQEQVFEAKRFDDGAEIDVHALLDPEGAPLRWVGGLARLPDGGWIVADEEADALLLYDRGFRVRARWTRPEGGPAFSLPSAVRVRGDDIWVLEQARSRARRLTTEGAQVTMFGAEGRAPGQLLFPTAIDACPDGGWVAVADLGNFRVQRYTFGGQFIDGFEPAPANDEAPVQLLDLAVSDDCERIYLADSKGDRVLVTRPNGDLIVVLGR